MTVATDASLEKEAFDPAEILASVDRLLGIVTEIWTEGVRIPDGRADLALIQRWARSVVTDLGDGVCLIRSHVDVLRVVSRPGELEDRVVLRVTLRLRRPRGQPRGFGVPRVVRTELRWTLGRAGAEWKLLTLDAGALSDETLQAALIPGAWADEDRLWEEALADLADADLPSGHTHLRDLVSLNGSVSEQLSEVSTLDRRFDHDLLSARLRRIVEAWEESCTGSEEVLSEVAAANAVEMLLHGPPRDQRLRLILHDATIDHWRPVKLDLSAAPQIQIAIVLSAVRYLVHASTGRWASGDFEERHRLALEWTLTLYRDPGARWQLTTTTSPITQHDPTDLPRLAQEVGSKQPGSKSRRGVGNPLTAGSRATYSEPPPADGPWTGSSDQSLLHIWLQRRRRRRTRQDQLNEP